MNTVTYEYVRMRVFRCNLFVRIPDWSSDSCGPMSKREEARMRILREWDKLPEHEKQSDEQALEFLFNLALHQPDKVGFDGYGFTEALHWLKEKKRSSWDES